MQAHNLLHYLSENYGMKTPKNTKEELLFCIMIVNIMIWKLLGKRCMKQNFASFVFFFFFFIFFLNSLFFGLSF